ncbi:MAG: hypothetical protein NC829_03700 [Candidatus Omnitrophica bacterium]|nr:hypothetical protein [Candidatus Omnitrophota bacterium]
MAKIKGINRVVVNISPFNINETRPIKAYITKKRLELLREIDDLVTNMLKDSGFYYKIWQCPVVIVPLNVNKKGSEFVVIRPVLSERAMTAKAAILPIEIIKRVSSEIIKFPEVSGVAIDITSKPPATIEWE